MNQAGSGAFYGVGVLGALVYYIQTASSFMDGVWGVVLSFFWPAAMVYEALKFFRA